MNNYDKERESLRKIIEALENAKEVKSDTFKYKKVEDTRRIKLEDVEKQDYIPFMAGRPERDTYITKDDIINLRIQLENLNDVSELV